MNRKLSIALVALVTLVLLAATLTACGSPPSGSTGSGSTTNGSTAGANSVATAPAVEEVTSASFNVETPTLVVATFGGNIEITIGSGTAVKIDVTKHGSGDLKNIQVAMTQEGSTVRVTAKRTGSGDSSAAVKVSVPSGSILDLQTGNGKVTVSGAVADVSIKSANGAIEVRGATGALDLQASNANITANGGSGKLKLATSNGTIDAITTAEVLVDVSNVNGAVHFTGPLSAKGKNSLRSSNAVVAVTLPAASSFTLNAVTTNGKIASDFAVKGTNKTDQQLKGTVGDNPQATLNLNTSNGTIEIHKGP